MREQLISALDSAAHAWLMWMWPMAWQVSVLVLVLGLLTWLLRDRSARLRYAMWLLVPIRLVLPPTLALATGWGWWVLPAEGVADAQAERRALTTASSRDIEMMVGPVVEQQPQMEFQPDNLNPASPLVVNPRALEVDAQANAIPPIESDTLESTTPVVSMTWQSSLYLVWVLGVVLLMVRFTHGLIRAAGMIRRSAVPTRTGVVDLLENCRRQMGMRRSVRVRELPDAGVPMLIGVVRPTIILPKDIDRRLSSCELEAVLVHELHHVARHDAFVNLAQTLLGIVYFFHPLVWLANRVLSRLREDACDEATVAVLERHRRDYGAGIVKIAEMVSNRPPSMALGIVERSGQVKRRLQRILDPHLPLGRRLSWSALALLLVVGAVLLPAAARPGDPEPLTTTETSSDTESGETLGGQADDDGTRDDKSKSKTDASSADKKKPPKDLVTINGVVVDKDNTPVQGVNVFVEWRGLKHGRAETQTDGQGRFAMTAPRQLLRGRLVRAIADSGRRQAQYQFPREDDAATQREIRLQLHPARRVELHVVDGAGKAIANAKTGVMGNYNVLDTGTTGDEGRVVFWVPHDIRVEYVFAISNGHGVDYKAYVLPRGRSGDKKSKAPELPEEPVRLTLDGVNPLNVQVVEPDGSPIAGIKLYPWYLKKPDQPNSLNLSYFIELVQTQTDESGKAVFDWLPHWNERKSITIWLNGDGYLSQRGIYDFQTGDGTLTMKLDKLVLIRGRVTLPDGSPANGIQVTARGRGYQVDRFRSTSTTDDNGRYEFKAAPNMVYLIIVSDKKWAAAPHTGFALWPGKPIENLDFALRPATRLFGRVTVGPKQKPVEGQRISVYQYGQGAHNIKDLNLPNPEKSRSSTRPTIVHSTSSDENGNFELFVGDGKFDIRGPTQNKVEKFEIKADSAKEFTLHATRPEKGILRGSVVSGDPPQPVSSAKVYGIYRYNLAGRDLQAVTDKSGRFEVERELHRTVIYARSKDGRLAGVVQIEPDDKTVTIPIRPLGTATGRLLDATTKEPLEDREIVYGVKVHLGDDNAAWRTSFGGKTTTDRDGRFDLHRLILGQDYGISVTIRRDAKNRGTSWTRVGDVKAEDVLPIKLGNLVLTPPRKPLTTEDRIAAAFKVKGTPVERFKSARHNAAIGRQRVLIVFGNPKGDKIQQFMKLRYDDRVVRSAMDPFRIMAVDSSAGKLSNANELARSITENLDGARSDFSVFVTDSEGKRLASAEAGALLIGEKFSKDKLLAFLRQHTLEPLDARKLLKDALARAKKENKRVIVQETATWCAPCLLLSQFLERERVKWERDYIWVKMDHRWIGAQEMMKELRDGADGGVPWWAILNENGKVLVTSNDGDGNNIGFPRSERERAHFRAMLEQTAIRLKADNITSLVDALNRSEH